MLTTRRLYRPTIVSTLACALLACPSRLGARDRFAENCSRGRSGGSRRSAATAKRLVQTLLILALAAGLLYWPMSADARPQTPWPTDGQVRIYNPTGWQHTMRVASE